MALMCISKENSIKVIGLPEKVYPGRQIAKKCGNQFVVVRVLKRWKDTVSIDDVARAGGSGRLCRVKIGFGDPWGSHKKRRQLRLMAGTRLVYFHMPRALHWSPWPQCHLTSQICSPNGLEKQVWMFRVCQTTIAVTTSEHQSEWTEGEEKAIADKVSKDVPIDSGEGACIPDRRTMATSHF